MNTDVRSNPTLLKLDLYCKGLQIDDTCYIEEDGGRSIMRTRAGLGSGLELILPHGLWTNAPVAEAFAAKSPYVLRRKGGLYRIYRGQEVIAPAIDHERRHSANPPPWPWIERPAGPVPSAAFRLRRCRAGNRAPMRPALARDRP